MTSRCRVSDVASKKDGPTVVAVDGRAILLAKVREIRLQQHRFLGKRVLIFVPDPGIAGASEAFVSAREKQRAFSMAGFNCEVCRIGNAMSTASLSLPAKGDTMCIIQRPLEPSVIQNDDFGRMVDLDAASETWGATSALAEAVSRIVLPFLSRSSALRVAVVGNRGNFGKEIEELLWRLQVSTIGVDVDDEIADIEAAQIVISAVGKSGLIKPSMLGTSRKTLLVDVGYCYDETAGRGFGDFDERCYACAHFYTPVPGGVGPLQVLTLVERAALLLGIEAYSQWTLPDTEVVRCPTA